MCREKRVTHYLENGIPGLEKSQEKETLTLESPLLMNFAV